MVVWFPHCLGLTAVPVGPHPEKEAAENPGAVASLVGQVVTGPNQVVASTSTREKPGDLDSQVASCRGES